MNLMFGKTCLKENEDPINAICTCLPNGGNDEGIVEAAWERKLNVPYTWAPLLGKEKEVLLVKKPMEKAWGCFNFYAYINPWTRFIEIFAAAERIGSPRG